MVHADFEQPILNLFLFTFADHVLHGHIDVVGGWNIGKSKFIILGDIIIIRIINNITDVKVTVQQN